MKEFFELVNTIVSRLFDLSANKKIKEIDLNERSLKMAKENDFSSIINVIIEERVLKLLTGKNVNISFAEKIQKLKVKLGGNITDKQLYSILNFYKEDINGDLFIDISKTNIFLTKFFAVFILVTFCVSVICLAIVFNEINTINNLILYISAILFCGIGGLFFLNLIGNDLTAIQIKKKFERL